MYFIKTPQLNSKTIKTALPKNSKIEKIMIPVSEHNEFTRGKCLLFILGLVALNIVSNNWIYLLLVVGCLYFLLNVL